MRSELRHLLPLGAATAVLVSSIVLAAPTAPQPGASVSTSEARPADQAAQAADPAEATAFRYGPILAKDADVRVQIKKLYRDQFDAEQATQVRLEELAAALATETDADFQVRIQRDIMQAKSDLQLRSMELGLEIARLNGDEARVADYERALDQLKNPEKYMPATLDPSIAKERARRMGLEN